MSRNRRIISTMVRNNVAVLYIDNNAYVTEDIVKSNSLIRKMVSGAEAFKYDYLASYGVENASKKAADDMYTGKYVVRFANADKCGNESVYSA